MSRRTLLRGATAGGVVLGGITLPTTAAHAAPAPRIEHEGTYVSADVPTALFDMSVLTCAWLCNQYGLDPHVAIVGHRDYNSTQCPGDVFYARLPELRDRVAEVMLG